jgi:hypothetical protein
MSEIEEVSRHLGSAPRRFGFIDRLTYLRPDRPRWAKRDPLARFFERFGSVLERGRVTWGHIIQVNEQLFSKGPRDHPGEVLYSSEPSQNASPGLLEPIASACFALKNTTPIDADQCPIADYLTDQKIRVFGLDVPKTLSGHTTCKISTVMFIRNHLPNGIVSLPFFPIVFTDDGVAAVVPSRYWSKSFQQAWHQEEDASAGQPAQAE